MACRECKHWHAFVLPEEEIVIRRTRRGACRFPIDSILPASVGRWSLLRFETGATTLETEGEGCPQFKEREDGD